MKFSIVSKAMKRLLGFCVAAMGSISTLHAGTDVVLMLRALKAPFPVVKVLYHEDVIVQKDKVFQSFQLQSAYQEVKLPTSVWRCGYVSVESAENTLDVLIQPGDTLFMSFRGEDEGWQLDKGNALQRMKMVWTIDSLCDDALIRSRMNRAVPFVKQMRYFSDTLQTGLLTRIDPVARRYGVYRAALTEIEGDVRMRSELMQRYFSAAPQFDNPAWQEAFQKLFAGSLQRELVRAGGDTLRKALDEGASVKVDSILRERWAALHPEVRSLALWLGIYRRCQNRDVDRKPFMEWAQREKELGSPALALQMQVILEQWSRLAKGSALPEFSYDWGGKTASLAEWKGKPVYLVYYPNYNQEVHREWLMLKGLYAKYKSKMEFLVVVQSPSKAGLNRAIQELQGGYRIVPLDACSEAFREIPERLDQRSYILLDAKGAVFQAPAEGPETGVDQAFPSLIR